MTTHRTGTILLISRTGHRFELIDDALLKEEHTTTSQPHPYPLLTDQQKNLRIKLDSLNNVARANAPAPWFLPTCATFTAVTLVTAIVLLVIPTPGSQHQPSNNSSARSTGRSLSLTRIVGICLLVIFALSVVLSLLRLRSRLRQFQKAITKQCQAHSDADATNGEGKLVWHYRGTPRWAWPVSGSLCATRSSCAVDISVMSNEDSVAVPIDDMSTVCESPVFTNTTTSTTTLHKNSAAQSPNPGNSTESFSSASPKSSDDVYPRPMIQEVRALPAPTPTTTDDQALTKSNSILSSLGRFRRSSSSKNGTNGLPLPAPVPIPVSSSTTSSPRYTRMNVGSEGTTTTDTTGGGEPASRRSYMSSNSWNSNEKRSSSTPSHQSASLATLVTIPMPLPCPDWPVSPEPPPIDSILTGERPLCDSSDTQR